MKQERVLVLFFLLMIGASAFAQKEKLTREDKDEKNQARTARISNKNDFAIFRRQMLALKEYTDERNKIPALQKANKMPVRIVAAVDTTGDMDDEASKKTLQGYIRQDIGDNSTIVYELTFDRATKKIATIKRTPEAEDMEREEKATDKKPGAPKTLHKKVKDEDDDDDPDDDKPVKTRQKEKDDDKE